jgi:hypothetical protein
MVFRGCINSTREHKKEKKKREKRKVENNT